MSSTSKARSGKEAIIEITKFLNCFFPLNFRSVEPSKIISSEYTISIAEKSLLFHNV